MVFLSRHPVFNEGGRGGLGVFSTTKKKLDRNTRLEKGLHLENDEKKK